MAELSFYWDPSTLRARTPRRQTGPLVRVGIDLGVRAVLLMAQLSVLLEAGEGRYTTAYPHDRMATVLFSYPHRTQETKSVDF